MIKMTYSQVSGFDFTRTMQKLAGAPFNPQTAYRIKKLVDALNRQRKIIHDEYQKDIQDTYAKRDESGKIVVGEGGQGFEVADDKREEFEKAQEAFGNREFTIDRPKLSFQELAGFQVSASDIANLESIVDFPEEGDAAQTPNVVNMR